MVAEGVVVAEGAAVVAAEEAGAVVAAAARCKKRNRALPGLSRSCPKDPSHERSDRLPARLVRV